MKLHLVSGTLVEKCGNQSKTQFCLLKIHKKEQI